MNKTILLGRLTKEPEIRVSQTNNVKVASFTLAVNRKFVREGEERQADFINIVAWSKLAEFVEKYIKKGNQICVAGRIQTRVWSDNDGNRHYVTEIIAEEIDFADSVKKVDESILYSSTRKNTNDKQLENIDIEDEIFDTDELPF